MELTEMTKVGGKIITLTDLFVLSLIESGSSYPSNGDEPHSWRTFVLYNTSLLFYEETFVICSLNNYFNILYKSMHCY